VKRGALGCCFIEGDIPARLDATPTYLGERVEVMNVLGAGDAFAVRPDGQPVAGQKFWARPPAGQRLRCHGGVPPRLLAPAMPTPAELAHWFGGQRNPRSMPTSNWLICTAPPPARHWPELCVMAFDHRSQFSTWPRGGRQ
jgi:5-dehydro-2-deoxygluconokinase